MATREKNSISSIDTIRTFLREGTWSETIMSVVDRSFDHPMKPEERAAMPFAGGVIQQGYQCGMLWGAALAAGAQAYRLHGPGPVAEAEAVRASQMLVDSFRARARHINCLEITEMDFKASSQDKMLRQVFKFFIRGGPIGCFRMAARYAPVAYSEINAAYSENHREAPAAPVSCAATLARRMGASDLHTVMVAGFAGGIGLSGGACGVLGAAIWFLAMEGGMEEVKGMELAPPGAEEVVEKFLECSDYEFECAKIVGRKFDNVGDHAVYLRDGGCSKIVDALATNR